MGRAAGVTDAQLRDISVYKESPAFTPLEKLVVEYAAEMTRTPVGVPHELFAALRRQFNDAQLVELTTVVAQENFHARLCQAWGIEAPGFSERADCALLEPPQAQAGGRR